MNLLNLKCLEHVIGVGRLGGAMASYRSFSNYGLEICGLVDNDPSKIGLVLGEHAISGIENLQEIVRRQKVDLGIITVPPEAAQNVADKAVTSGLRALWNFATVNLKVPNRVFVRYEHISVGLAELRYHLNLRK